MHACNFLMGGASLVFAFLLAFKFGQISLSGPWGQKIESAKVAVNHVIYMQTSAYYPLRTCPWPMHYAHEWARKLHQSYIYRV